MARPKPFHRYPPTYRELVASASEAPVRIECKSERRARSMRNELYTYRSVLFRHADRQPTAENLQLAILADWIQFRIEGTELIAEPRSIESFITIDQLLEQFNATQRP